MKDLHSHVSPAVAVAPAVLTANTNSTAVDLLGFSSAVAVIATGAIAGDGKFSVKLQHSDVSGSGWADVPEGGVYGTVPAELAADGVYKLGYTGGSAGQKRYLRAVLTKASGTSIAASVVVVRGHPALSPA